MCNKKAAAAAAAKWKRNVYAVLYVCVCVFSFLPFALFSIPIHFYGCVFVFFCFYFPKKSVLLYVVRPLHIHAYEHNKYTKLTELELEKESHIH